MYQLFDASFFRVKGTVQELAPMVAKHGMGFSEPRAHDTDSHD